MKNTLLLIAGFLFVLLFPLSPVWASPPTVMDITVTDVTPVSFSVIWNTDQASTCSLTVFNDENGVSDISSTVTITPHPTRNNNSSVVAAAQNRGVMKVRITGLFPATTYYFRTSTITVSSAEESIYPQTAPYLAVTTAAISGKTAGDTENERPFTNDLISMNVYESDGTTPAQGALVLGVVEGGRYPVSSFVGDEFPSPQAALDLNNIYTDTVNKNIFINGGETITLSSYYGIEGVETTVWVVPANHTKLVSRSPVGLADVMLIVKAMNTPDGGPDLSHIADINDDNRIGLQESVNIMEKLSQVR